MLRKPALLLWALAFLATAFFAGALRLLQLRLSRGDVYPPYSTLRSDPLGCKVLYEGLGAMDGVVSLRNFRSWNKALPAASGTFLLLGLNPARFAETDRYEAEFLEDFLRAGGRVVIAFRSDPEALEEKSDEPPAARPERGPERKGAAPAGRKRAARDDGPKEETPSFMEGRFVDLGGRFGVKLPDLSRRARETGAATLAKKDTGTADDLPALSWHGSLHFELLNRAWRVVYRADSWPVVIERPYGRGALVLCADSYPFSNEAVYHDPAPGFLSWSLGPSRRFLFDETHLRVTETPGLASLLRQYRLHGFVFGGLFLALLFIWKNSLPLLPPSAADDRSEAFAVQGREAFQGLTGLLRRSVPPGRVLEVCYGEWRKRCARQDPAAAARLDALWQARSGAGLEPAALYRELQDVLNQKTLR